MDGENGPGERRVAQAFLGFFAEPSLKASFCRLWRTALTKVGRPRSFSPRPAAASLSHRQ